MRNGELHVVSTGRQPPQQFAEVVESIHTYIDFVHIREKNKSASEIYELVQLLTDHSVPLFKIIVNDRVDVASISKVKGVQLAYHSLPTSVVKKEFPSLQVGCSVHSRDEAQQAEEQGADYVVYGHIFPTNLKPGLEAKGLEALEKICRTVNLPVVAIGGIQPENTKQVIEAGAKGVAVMSGILEADDPLHAVKAYRDRLH
ncbi:thiazole tautomerase TenI [Radiobacillus kanasensis]|uniref:thiazole tautomerase TenI n=1 Tax=Radiobacillus kanasensis TaxID=2844358 RepID=UPI001E5E4853|nr:thiazole tautomerase TenI [Radiobacillus kanasensis]UFT98556.1 thiazole tautomerase TenI [Radiobacillus kanasensis]